MANFNNNEIGYLNSFSANTSVVTEVIEKLINDLKLIDYRQDEIDEIVLSMDEAITNAVQVTIRKTEKMRQGEYNPDRRDITIRYTITDSEFDATIIDHGKGLDLFNILQTTPSRGSIDYQNQIISYASESEMSKIRVTVNGKEIPLRGIGAGLKIILNFMDTITIDLIDKEKVLSSTVSEHTDGTIFNMKRHRRYQ